MTLLNEDAIAQYRNLHSQIQQRVVQIYDLLCMEDADRYARGENTGRMLTSKDLLCWTVEDGKVIVRFDDSNYDSAPLLEYNFPVEYLTDYERFPEHGCINVEMIQKAVDKLRDQLPEAYEQAVDCMFKIHKMHNEVGQVQARQQIPVYEACEKRVKGLASLYAASISQAQAHNLRHPVLSGDRNEPYSTVVNWLGKLEAAGQSLRWLCNGQGSSSLHAWMSDAACALDRIKQEAKANTAGANAEGESATVGKA